MYWARTDTWYLERIIWLIAGIFTLTGTILGWLVSPWFLVLNILVGVNLLILAFSGFCLMAQLLYALGARPQGGCSAAGATETPPEP